MKIGIFSGSAGLAAFRVAPLLLAAVLFSGRSQADWVNNGLSGMPVDAIVGGQLATGAPAYLCRAYHGSDVQPGWTEKGDPTCHFSYAGQELTSTNFDWWIPSWRSVIRGRPTPANLIPFRGEDNAFRYPCRVGGTLGKFGFDLGGCLYPYGGAERNQPVSGFQLLTDPDGGNVDVNPGMAPTFLMEAEQFVGPFKTELAGLWEGNIQPLPMDAIVGGADVDGQPLYICSADVSEAIDPVFYTSGSRQPGKSRADWNACDVSYGGLENYKSTFWVLVPDWLSIDMPSGDTVSCAWYWLGRGCAYTPHPIEVGRDTNGEVLYACQVLLYPGPGRYPGKVGASFGGGCSYAMNGIENYSQYFSLLTDGATDNFL